MRLVTWNCCTGPLQRKLAALDGLAADVAVVPESPKLRSESLRERWFGDNPKKGVAVLARPGFDLLPIQTEPGWPRHVIPIQVRGQTPFLLLAVWARNDKPDKYVRGVVRSIDVLTPLMTSQATVVMGDLNSNTIWDREHPEDQNHSALVARLESVGLISAYHSHFGEAQGAETRPTQFLWRHEDRPFHIDYCFVPRRWRVRCVEVGAFADWRRLSDHMPLILDIDDGSVSRLPAEPSDGSV
jgi:hypothetical protein